MREVKMPIGHGEKVRKSLIGIKLEKARAWKGDKAGYVAKHTSIVKNYGKAFKCQNIDCKYPRKVGRIFMNKPKRYEWANISGLYKRSIDDYLQLCPSCHRKWDMGLIELNIEICKEQ